MKKTILITTAIIITLAGILLIGKLKAEFVKVKERGYTLYAKKNNKNPEEAAYEISGIKKLVRMQTANMEEADGFILLNLINIGYRNPEDLKLNAAVIHADFDIEKKERTTYAIVFMYLFAVYLLSLYVYKLSNTRRKYLPLHALLMILLPPALFVYIAYVSFTPKLENNTASTS